MKKSVLTFGFVFTLFAGISVFGQNSNHKTASLDTSYISTNSASTYKEWTGGYAPSEINTAEQIKDIGRRLGRGINYQESVQGEDLPYNKGNPAYKYSSARIYGQNKRGADVLLIGQTATVDTVKCLKLIIRGYLESAFACDDQTARQLAESICYWNTNNYAKTEFFQSAFESGVTQVFEGRYTKVGLSQDYKDWKQSILIIPHEFAQPAPAYTEPQPEPEPAYQEPEPASTYQEPARVSPSTSRASDSSASTKSDNTHRAKKSGLPGYAYALIAVLAVLLLALVIVLIVNSRNKKES